MDLRLTVFQSGISFSAAMVGARAVRLGALIVLARLLEPADFGLLAAALVPVVGLTTIARFGLGAALVASKDDKHKAAHHVFAMTCLTGLGLSLALALGAGPYASLYEDAALEPVIQVMAVVVLLDALLVAPEGLLIKEMMFARHILSTLIGLTVGAAVSIALAFLGAGAWSLVIGAVVTSAVTLACLVLACPHASALLRPAWDGAVARNLLSIASRNTASQIIGYYNHHIDRLAVGNGLGLQQLGFYHQGFNVASIPVHAVSDVANYVLLPAFSRISDERERLAKAFVSSFQMVAVLALPSAVGVFALAPEAVVVLLGDKWREAVAVIQVLALMIVFRPFSRTASSLFLSLGVPQYNVWSSLTQAVCITLLILPALQFGIVGVASIITFAYGAGLLLNMFLVAGKTGLGIRLGHIFSPVLPTAWSSLFLLAYLVGIKTLCAFYAIDTYNLVFLFVAGISGFLVYLSAAFLFQRAVVVEVGHMLRRSATATSERLKPGRSP